MKDKLKKEYRNRVRDRFLIPKLYKLGYLESDMEIEAKELVRLGRRKVYIESDLILQSGGRALMVCIVRSGAEKLTEYIKDQAFSYAHLSIPTIPLVLLTNGIETTIYNSYTGEKLEGIPSNAQLYNLNLEGDLGDDLRAKALDKVFASVSLWDETKRLSNYNKGIMTSFYHPDLKTPFNTKIFHNSNRWPDIPKKGEEVSIRVSSESNLMEKVYIYYTVDGGRPEGKKGQSFEGEVLELKKRYKEASPGSANLIEWWENKIPLTNKGTKVRYIVEGYNSKEGKSYFAEGGDNSLVEAGIFSYSTKEYHTPRWAKEAIVYQIQVDRFSDGDPSNNYDLTFEATGYQGGDLQGIIDRLNHIRELGATAIWLTPFYKGEAYHGYHITDFLEVDPHFGDNNLLKELIDKAHSKGLKVILDMVPNHSSNKHPFFLEAQSDKSSPCYKWYKFNCWPNDYQSFCGLEVLPKVNTDNPDTRHHIIYQQALNWLQNYGVDGLRLDHANGPSHDFWVDFRETIKEVKPDAYIFGEVWEGPGITKEYEGELDGCFDFSIVWSFRELFIYGSKKVSEFKEDLDYLDGYYDSRFILGRFLDNHDMDRFLWEAKGDKRRLKLAAICQFSLKGTQFIYYGTEVGLSQKNPCYDDNTGGIVFDNSRDFMPWDDSQDRNLYSFYQSLCKVRRENKALSYGKRRDILLDDTKGIWAYIKSYKSNQLLVLLNTKDEGVEVEFDLKGEGFAGDKLSDLLTSRDYKLTHGKLKLELSPLTGLILGS